MTMTYVPASEKQEQFIRDLLAARVVPQEMIDDIVDRIDTGILDKRFASTTIDTLLGLPKNKKSTPSPIHAALLEVPKSMYAVPTEQLELEILDAEFTGDLAFFEVKEYNGVRYMRQLHGSPGGFVRSKLPFNAVMGVISIISRDPHAHALLFGRHYTCCGSCGAPLTDERSRELMLGPECRKKFGFK